MARQRDDWVYTTRIHSTDAAFSKRGWNELTSVYLWTRPDSAIPTAHAAALFSRFAVSQSMKNKSRFKSLSGVNYADPAFSPDPLSNLNFFSSKQSPAWSDPPGPGHQSPKKRRPRAKNCIPPQPPNSPALPEPTSTDISTATSTINSPSFTTSSTSSPRPPPAAPSAPSNPSSFPVPHVHTRPDMPHDAHHHTLLRRHSHHGLPPKPEPKKGHGFLSKLFGSSKSELPESTASSSAPPPPPKNRRPASMRIVPQSPSLPHDRARQGRQLRIASSSPEMSMLEDPTRPAMTRVAAEASRIILTHAAPPAVDDQWMHQDLDRIDELDESNPFGGVMHNGGPYEAVSRFVQMDLNQKPHVKPPRVQQNSDRNFMMSDDIYRNAQIVALQKGSLGLKPGQVLSQKVPRVEPSHNPYPQPDFPPQQNRHHDPRHNYPQPGVAIRDGRPPLEELGSIPVISSVLQANPSGTLSGSQSSSPITHSPPNNQTPSPTPTFIQYDNQDSGFAIGMAMMSDDEITPNPTNGTTITQHSSESSLSANTPIKIVVNEPSIDERRPSPPPYTFEPPNLSSNEVRAGGSRTQEAAATGPSDKRPVFNRPHPPSPETTPPPPRMPSTSSISRNGTWHPQPVQSPPPPPPQLPSGHSRREVHSLQPPPLQERITPGDSGPRRASTYAASSSGVHTDRVALASSLQRGESVFQTSVASGVRGRESDTRSVQPTIMTTSNISRMTGSTQAREDYRRNRYLPKHLVMPTPLQPALQNRIAVEQARLDPRASLVHPRDSSPSKRRSTLVASPIPRAEDVPIAPSGKLRKRVSLLGGKKEQALPVAAVSFLANIVTSEQNDHGPGKPRKNVLSKRR